jgi:hypothetical protein
MDKEKKKLFEKIDIEQLKQQQQSTSQSVDEALKEIASNIEKKKKMKL